MAVTAISSSSQYIIVSIHHRLVHRIHLDGRERFRLESRPVHAVDEVDNDLDSTESALDESFQGITPAP
jgi:hypothetical protein